MTGQFPPRTIPLLDSSAPGFSPWEHFHSLDSSPVESMGTVRLREKSRGEMSGGELSRRGTESSGTIAHYAKNIFGGIGLCLLVWAIH